MKKIINGKKYDTETAEWISSYDVTNGKFSDYEEDLYRKRTGEFFLAGEGGPASKYSQPYGDHGSQSGKGIIPLTEEEAREWVEMHCSADKYEDIFGEVEE